MSALRAQKREFAMATRNPLYLDRDGMKLVLEVYAIIYISFYDDRVDMRCVLTSYLQPRPARASDRNSRCAENLPTSIVGSKTSFREQIQASVNLPARATVIMSCTRAQDTLMMLTNIIWIHSD